MRSPSPGPDMSAAMSSASTAGVFWSAIVARDRSVFMLPRLLAAGKGDGLAALRRGRRIVAWLGR